MKGICYITPILGTTAGCREIQSHNRMIDLHLALAKKYIAHKCI